MGLADQSAGSVTIPQGTSPGDHLLTVRGFACEFNVVVTVVGVAATRSLAFTGSSSHTLTYVLVGVVAVMLGAVFVLGSRRATGALPVRRRRCDQMSPHAR